MALGKLANGLNKQASSIYSDGTWGWGYNPRSDFDPFTAWKNEEGGLSGTSLGIHGALGLGALKGGKGLPFAKATGRSLAGGVARESIGAGQSAIRDMAGAGLSNTEWGRKWGYNRGSRLAAAQQAEADKWRQNVGMATDWMGGAGAPISAIADNLGYMYGGFKHIDASPGEVAKAIPMGYFNAGSDLVNTWTGGLTKGWGGGIYDALASPYRSYKKIQEEAAAKERLKYVQDEDAERFTRLTGKDKSEMTDNWASEHFKQYTDANMRKTYKPMYGDYSTGKINTPSVRSTPVNTNTAKPVRYS